jgi:hypothetical protein
MLVVFLFPNYSFGQIANYVNNGSFEDYLNCNQSSQLLIAKYWSGLDTNKYYGLNLTSLPPTGQVPLSSYSYQMPRTGNNYFASTLIFKPNTPQVLQAIFFKFLFLVYFLFITVFDPHFDPRVGIFL